MIQMANQTGAAVEKPSASAERPMDINTKLAFERTNLAHERTLMAWVRTATSLITFGFTIYKFFQLEKGQIVGVQHQVIGPRHFAMLMIAVGILSLVIATIEHLQHVVSMRKEHIETRRSLAAWVAGLISLLGLLALAAVIFRL